MITLWSAHLKSDFTNQKEMALYTAWFLNWQFLDTLGKKQINSLSGVIPDNV